MYNKVRYRHVNDRSGTLGRYNIAFFYSRQCKCAPWTWLKLEWKKKNYEYHQIVGKNLKHAVQENGVKTEDSVSSYSRTLAVKSKDRQMKQ